MSIVVTAIKQKGCPEEILDFLQMYMDSHIDSEGVQYYWGRKPHNCPSCECIPPVKEYDNIVVVARNDGKLVGISLLATIPEPYNEYYPTQGWNSVTLVHPEWRGRGVGSKMLQAKIDAMGRGYHIHAVVGDTNIASLRMCEKVYGKPIARGTMGVVDFYKNVKV